MGHYYDIGFKPTVMILSKQLLPEHGNEDENKL